MAVGDLLSQVGIDKLPGGGFSLSFLGDLSFLIVFLLLAAAVTFWYINKKSYKKTIVKFREINGVVRRVGTEKAKEIVLPNTSIRAFYLRSSKFYLPRPSIETGVEEYWYFVRDDGEWLNIGLTNVNEMMKKLNIKFDHTDMRMANAALKRLIDKAYKKSNWIKEWAPYIGFAVIIIMLGIAGFLVMGESAKVVSAAAKNVESLSSITEALKDILVNINNIASSSGVRPAG